MNRRAILCLALLAAPFAGTPLRAQGYTEPDSARWTIMLGGRNAGEVREWRLPDGELRWTSKVNDRGRGAELETRIRMGPDGVPVMLHTTGVDYLKNPVDEQFQLASGRATWRSASEHGDTAVSAPAWFVAMNDASDPGLMTRFLLARPDHAIPMLPGGRATVARVGDLQVSAGGKTRTVTQYRVSGFGFEPGAVWLNPDGSFFAQGGGWGGTIETGWESVLPELSKAQDAADEQR